MCAVVGLLSTNQLGQTLYDALTALQHRGQDAAGIATSDGSFMALRKGKGLVREALSLEDPLFLRGQIGIGHVRYPTAGGLHQNEAQPFYVNFPYGLALAHNGNLVNAKTLAKQVSRVDRRHLRTTSDSEIVLNLLATALLRAVGDAPLSKEAIFEAVKAVFERSKGGYAVVVLIVGYGLLAFRDPHGIRPLVWGERQEGNDRSYMIASESVALQALDFAHRGDVAPGEAVFIDMNGNMHRQACAENVPYTPCLFEYIYLARVDSVMDGLSVHRARLLMGEYLAKRVQETFLRDAIDVVMPIPETSSTAALALAAYLGIPYREGFVKNRYIGRTFIMPNQVQRERSVRHKLNVIAYEFSGKRVLLVDDSVVRGTTSKQVVAMARRAGARNVYFASVAPAIRYPNIYGIDMPSKASLIAAHDRSDKTIAEMIGADGIIFQRLDDLYAAMRDAGAHTSQFEDSVFTGHYVTGDVSDAYFEDLARVRGGGASSD